MRVITLALFLVMALLALSGFALASTEEVMLPPANFDSPVTKVFGSSQELAAALKSGGPAVVCFFNARCPHCKTFAPDYINAARKASSDGPKNVKFYALDAEQHPDIPAGFQFTHYPGIFYVDGKGRHVTYTDSRDAFTLHAFVKSATAAPSFLEAGAGAETDYASLQKVDLSIPTDCVHQEAEEAFTAPFSLAETDAESLLEAEADADALEGAEAEAEEALEAELEADVDAEAEMDAEEAAEGSLLEAEADAAADAELDEAAELEAEADALLDL